MKTLAKKLPVLIITICSLFALNSCGSTPKVPEIQQSAEEETTDSNSINDNSQNTNEEENSVQIEKVDDDELLNTETDSKNTSADFTEPEVLDAVIEESTEETKIPQTQENTQETENIFPEKVEQTNEDLELSETQTTVSQNAETENSATAEQTITENSQEQNLGKESSITTVNTQNTQQTDSLSNSSLENREENLTEETNEENSNIQAEDELESSQTDSIVPSRTMTVKNNQYVDVVYPGRGWIYIGEEENDSPLFRYFGRKLGSENTTFTVRSIKSGKTLLHFYKNDVLTGNYIDDYLEILVTEEGASANERITAPSYAEVVPKKINTNTEQKTPATDETKDKATENSTKSLQNLTTQSVPDNSSDNSTDSKNNGQNSIQPENNIQQQNKFENAKIEKSAKKRNSQTSLLEQAKESLKNKDYENALDEIQEYLDTQNSKIDEALYVQGQILEADSSVRNIKSAIDSYDSLIKHYPSSKFWQDANKRKIYLNRYYINIY